MTSVPDVTKPSYHTSMTSQLMLTATCAYLAAGAFLLFKGNVEAGIAVFAGVFTTVKGLYDQAKVDSTRKNGHEEKPPEVKP